MKPLFVLFSLASSDFLPLRSNHQNSAVVSKLQPFDIQSKVIPLYSIKVYGEVGVELQSFLASALYGDEWSASCPGRFTPGMKTRYTLNRRPGVPQRPSGGFGEKK
jgi:hypothetical protein